MERNVKHLLLTKTDVLKTSIFSERKFEEMHQLWRAKGKRNIRGNVYICIIVFNCLSSTKHCLRFLLNCFVREIKVFYQRSVGKEVDFRNIMNVSLNILAKNYNSKKFKHDFVDERAMIKAILMSSCHWKTLVHFCLRKKRPKNAFLILRVNYRKFAQKNKLCHSKQQYIGYFMICDVI